MTATSPSATTIRCGYLATVLAAAIFGFFYAWVCSTMWGLDDADPRVAIAAMQAMNASVRNAVFFPAFFLTPIALAVAGLLFRRDGAKTSSLFFAAAAGLYLAGGLILTAAINVPMNQDLAAVEVPSTVDEAAVIWNDYSGDWQFWNTVRTVFSGLALLLAAGGLRHAGTGGCEVTHPATTPRTAGLQPSSV